MIACPIDHGAIKRDDVGWSRLDYVGIQCTPADDYGPAESLELRNCACGSTLCRLVESKAAA